MAGNRFSVRSALPADIEMIGYPALLSRPGFEPAMCRVGEADGLILSHALAERYTLRYGGARLRAAGIGRVYTEPGHRNRGYARAVIEDALTYIREQGAHLALLRDDSGYFERFGFSPVWPDYWMTFDSAQAASLGRVLKLRPVHPRDIPHMAGLYDRLWSGRVTLTRSPQMWMWRAVAAPEDQLRVVVNQQERVAGYLYMPDLESGIVEIAAETPESVITLLAACGEWMQQTGHDRVRWAVPPDDVSIYYARSVLDVTLSAEYALSGGWMARLINTAALVDALLPEITAQASSVLPDFDPAKLVFDCRPDRVRIGLNGRDTTFCYLTNRDFIQIVFGSLNPALGLHAGFHPDSIALLGALFPSRVAVIGAWDWF